MIVTKIGKVVTIEWRRAVSSIFHKEFNRYVNDTTDRKYLLLVITQSKNSYNLYYQIQ